MARQGKLRVYRTPIGFHDAYVAAPSQKAALAAWRSDHDLFARGAAEIVTDPELIAEPLAKPGTVIKRLRGTAAEQIAALPADPEPEAAKPAARGEPRQKPARKAPPKPKPRPSRDALDAAERVLEEAEARHGEEERKIARQGAELAQQRREMERRQGDERERLKGAREKAEAAYAAAMEKWRG